MATEESTIPVPPDARLCKQCGLYPAKPGRRLCAKCRYQQTLECGQRDPGKRQVQQDRKNELARQRYEEDPEPRRQQSRANHVRHQDKRNSQSRNYYGSTRGAILLQKKTAREADPLLFQARQYAAYHDDIEASREYQRGHYWKNPTARRAQLRAAERARKLADPVRAQLLQQGRDGRRKVRKHGVPFLWNQEYAAYALHWWKDACAYCEESLLDGFWHRLNWDHFVALGDPACLGTVPWNLLPSCGATRRNGTGRDVPLCNASKGSLPPHVWLLRMTVAQAERKYGRELTTKEQRICKGLVTKKLNRIALFFKHMRAYAVERGDVAPEAVQSILSVEQRGYGT